MDMDVTDKLEELKKNLEDLKKRWPAHSVKPYMVEEMERLEEEIFELTKLSESGQ